jgi:DNA-binding response OmpR family regulator
MLPGMFGRRQTVLVVEDDDDLRRMWRTALAFAGYEVHEASDGYGALNLIEHVKPHAVVLDLGLPQVSGQTVLAEAVTRRVPVVVVTGETVGAGELPGAHCVLRKPVTPERLVSMVRACIVAPSAEGC